MEIARKRPVSLQDALDVGASMVPSLFSKENSLLQRCNESPDARLYRDMAEAESKIAKRKITPAELITKEIEKLQRTLSVATDGSNIDREIKKLSKLLVDFSERAYSEGTLIQRDVLQSHRPRFPSPEMVPEVERFYPFSKGRSLRLRILHPNRPEHISGADVVYEFCDDQREMARFAFVQYKMWDAEKISNSRIDDRQLKKLRTKLCKARFCTRKKKGSTCFRMPYCSAFLRLTNMLQPEDTRHVSAGRFTPVCMVQTEGRGSLSRSDLETRDLSSDIFESAFAEGLAGSDWLPYTTVERMYRDCEILKRTDRLVIYASQGAEK